MDHTVFHEWIIKQTTRDEEDDSAGTVPPKSMKRLGGLNTLRTAQGKQENGQSATGKEDKGKIAIDKEDKTGKQDKGKAAGRGKDGKDLGKGGVKRHRKVCPSTIMDISNGGIRHLTRRADVKRIKKEVYNEVHGQIQTFMDDLFQKTTTYVDYNKRVTVTTLDVVRGLKTGAGGVYRFN